MFCGDWIRYPIIFLWDLRRWGCLISVVLQAMYTRNRVDYTISLNKKIAEVGLTRENGLTSESRDYPQW
jgi:hypothetical protein